MVALLLTGCPVQDGGAAKDVSNRTIRAVATTGMIGDLVQHVGGDRVELTVLMGPGVDPHLFKASEGDVQTLTGADVVFYNGLHLEAKLGELLEKLPAGRSVAVAGQIRESELLGWEGGGAAHDPHVWFDVALWLQALEQVHAKLAELDPMHKADYDQRYADYRTQLEELDVYVRQQAEKLPEAQRVLVTAHDAFRYFGRAYGFEVVGLQGISTEAQAGTADVQRLAKLIADRKVRAIFVESSVPVRNVEAVQAAVKARGWDVQIGGELFSDAMGDAGTPEGTYEGMVRHNIDTIVNALNGDSK
jgi:manganese/zinc/iron transport system substrate-binding protein